MAALPAISVSYGAPLEVKADYPAGVSGIASPASFMFGTFDLASSAGPAVNPASAMSVPAVASCVGLISGAIGALPVKVYRADAKGGREEATDHPAFALVHDDANPWTDAGQLREQLVIDALLRGNGYALVLRDGDGIPVELSRLAPDAVSVLIDQRTGEPWFKVSTTAGTETHPHFDVIHVAAPGGCGPDGISGVAPIVRARDTIALALALSGHAARIFRKGARPSGVIGAPNIKMAEGAENVRKSFSAQNADENSGGVAVLFNGMTFTPTEFKSVDAQFMEQRAFQIAEIAKAFNVPPTLVGELAKATLSNSETMGRQFLRHTLAPWLRSLRTGYRRALIAPEDRRTLSIDFDTAALLQADSPERAAFYASLRTSGIITANEARKAEGYPARPDGDSLASPHTTTGATPAPESTTDV